MSRKKHHEEEHVNHERWAISYLDMITVMMCLFIVLFAMSSVDQVKYQKLAASLSEGFGQGAGESQVLDGGNGIMDNVGTAPQGEKGTGDPFSMLETEAAGESPQMAAARTEVSTLEGIESQIQGSLAGTEAQNDVTFKIDERGLIIGLVSTDVFFEAESSRLTDRAHEAIGVIAPVLAAQANQIAVEGHANTLPTSRYASNWELSSERATTVLRSVVDLGGVDPSRMRAVGMGDAHPIDEPGADPMVANRRVDIIVMSTATEEIRNLIPQVVAAQEGQA